jgi:tRNA(fMet)-specific endonuclease VapC
MKYLLDTNVCIRYLNGRSTNIRQKVVFHGAQEIILCSVVKAELFYGAMKSNNPKRTLAKQHQFVSRFQSLPFDDNAAEIYSQIRATLEKQGIPIGPNDLLIASIAIANNLILITHNTREFSRIRNLSIEDWETS